MFPEEEDGTPEMGETEAPPTSVELSEDEVPATDITFECPHCSKSLSIDPRGAGLVILCVQCGQPVTVPIPEGLEIEDFDASPEDISVQLLHARQNLAKFQARISEMEQELDELRTFRENALRIGLLPPLHYLAIRFIGNASLTGAKRALLSQSEFARAQALSVRCTHVELAAEPRFSDLFMEHMFFPEEGA